MFDVTGPKVLVPSILFAIMTPELSGGFPRNENIRVQVGFHALLFLIFYILICKFVTKVTITRTDLIMTPLLFTVLSPGVFFSFPTSGGASAALVHSLFYAIIFAFIRGIFPEYY